ncbi:MAG: hypothetical protein LBU98_00050, partial [Alistipes sp.]|nr:hypothetical protein [Alistipes sp.]
LAKPAKNPCLRRTKPPKRTTMAPQHEDIPLHDGRMLRLRVAQSPLRPAATARRMDTATCSTR